MASSHINNRNSAIEARVRSAAVAKTQSRSPSKTCTGNTKQMTRVSSAPERISKHNKPSDRLNPKTIDPFNKSPKSVFASAYSKDAIPCRLVHGSVKHKLQWLTPPENLNYDPILITFAEGLKETIHPYAFVAHEGFVQLLMIDDAEERVLPLLPKLITPIKAALMSPDDKCFMSTLEALVELSNVTGTSFNQYLKHILSQISRRVANKNTKEKIMIALQKIECNGGAECTSIIKSRIPTYLSVL